MYQSILVPLKKAGGAEAHLRHAAALASKTGAKLILLCVITVVSAGEYVLQRIQIEEGSSGARRKAAAEEYLARLEEQLRGQGVAVKPFVIISGKAADEAIVECATRSNCDLIVLPNQNGFLVSRWLRGNVVARVQRHSRIPILLIGEEG